MSRFKEDISEAKERLKAWWDHELIDRPCLSYWVPKLREKLPDSDTILEFFDPFYLAEFWDDIDIAIDNYEAIAKIFYFGGENIPRFFPNYGPGIMASVFGIVPKFQSRTVWFHRNTTVDEIVSLLENAEINMNNPWYARLIRSTEIMAKRAGKDYCVAATDIGGVLDVLSSFLGPTKLILTMKRNPELIDTCRAIIFEKLMKVSKELFRIIGQYSDGYNSWMNIWCHKHWYPIQCDFSAFLSPKWFRRFALPDIIAQAEQLDYAIYHLDGPDALKHLDDLLEIPSINGIQWVPGAGNELKCNDAWMPIYKKIQKAEKNVVIDFFELPERLAYFYKELDPKGLFTTTIFMDYFRAKFYLPRFVGGEGGEGNFRNFKKEHRKELKEGNGL
jgi:hypothetical protein